MQCLLCGITDIAAHAAMEMQIDHARNRIAAVSVDDLLALLRNRLRPVQLRLRLDMLDLSILQVNDACTEYMIFLKNVDVFYNHEDASLSFLFSS